MRALLVEDGWTRGALAGARALRAAGWTVGVASPYGPRGLAAASRAVSSTHVVPPPTDPGFVRAVGLAARGCHVVLAAGDAELLALTYARDEVPAVVAHPPYEVVLRALDKAALGDAARAAGLRAPEEWPGTGRAVVKPRWHWRPDRPATATRVEAVVVDAAGVDAAVARVRAAGAEPLVQRYVPGALGALSGVVVDGRLVARVRQRAEATWPRGAGVSACAVTEPVDADLAGRVEALLRGLSWTGLAEVQLLGADVVLDLNGRLYGSVALAVAAGANLPAVAAAAAVGAPLPSVADARPGVRWSWFAGDVRAAGVAAAVRRARWPGEAGPGLRAARRLAARAVRKAVPR